MSQVRAYRLLALFLVFAAEVTSPLELRAEMQGRQECAIQDSSEALVYRDHTRLFTSISEARDEFIRLYESGRRLPSRAYFNTFASSFVIPHESGEIKMTTQFLQSLTRHIELALERGYADFIFYPDLGHGHLYLPEELKEIPLDAALAHPRLKILYHTAELFKLRDGDTGLGPVTTDPWLAWRYHSRNFTGDNLDGENLSVLFAKPPAYNTVRNLPGYVPLGEVYISASKSGCFSFKQGGEVRYFDLTLKKLASAPRP